MSQKRNHNSADARNKAAFVIDNKCTTIMQCLIDMLEFAYVINAEEQIKEVKNAVKNLHIAAADAHAQALREMKN